MKAVFADTSYYLALVKSLDQHHSAACQWTSNFSETSVTTAWVITELANAVSPFPVLSCPECCHVVSTERSVWFG